VIIDPITGIALNKWLFDENFTSKAAVLALAAIGFAVMCRGRPAHSDCTTDDESRYR